MLSLLVPCQGALLVLMHSVLLSLIGCGNLSLTHSLDPKDLFMPPRDPLCQSVRLSFRQVVVLLFAAHEQGFELEHGSVGFQKWLYATTEESRSLRLVFTNVVRVRILKERAEPF